VKEKPGGDGPVTKADKLVNDFLVESLSKEFPGDQVCAEESVKDSTFDFSKDRLWFVDPIDGTREFVSGSKHWAVMIGLALRGRPSLGVIYEPAVDRLLFGVRGCGAYIIQNVGSNPQPIHCARRTTAGEAVLVLSKSRLACPVLADLKSQLGIQRSMVCGSLGVKADLIATGQSDVYVNMSGRTSLWDTCAPEAIIEEAGGSVVKFNGSHINYSGFNGSLKRSSRIADSYIVLNNSVRDDILSFTSDFDRLSSPQLAA
jgi:3'(2'), 5'-bisphosphate nucleotidase